MRNGAAPESAITKGGAALCSQSEERGGEALTTPLPAYLLGDLWLRIRGVWCRLFHSDKRNAFRLIDGKYNCRRCGLVWDTGWHK